MGASHSLSDVAATGDRLATLQALRDVLAREIVSAESSRDVAALSRQLTMVLAEIDDLAPPVVTKRTALDELLAKRAAKASRPAGAASGE